MNFQTIARARARLAPRGPWQAVDLGTRMYRHWASYATRVWLAFTALPFALVLLAGYHYQSVWPLTLFWWLKPLCERPLLAFYSQALFAEPPLPGRLWRQWQSFMPPGLAAQLTWRRFSPARSFNTCIWQLEGAQREQLHHRLRVLNTSPSNRAGTLTLVMFHIEQCMLLALLALLYLLMPWQFNLEWSDWFMNQSSLHLLLLYLGYYAILIVLEPLYVATGFALYLNKRTWLEGWDLQRGFSRIAHHRGAMSLFLLVALLPLGLIEPGHAATDIEPSKQQAIDVLAGPDFMPLEERQHRQWAGESDTDWLDTLWRWLFDNMDDERPDRTQWDVPASLLRGLLWLAFGALALWLWLKVAQQLGLTHRARQKAQPLPSHVAGLDIRRQHLPKNLQQAVGKALDEGEVRLALSLLLRHTLARVLADFPVPLAAGSTEQSCLRLLKNTHGEPAPIRFLAALVDAWVSTAWAHRPASPEQVRALLAQCQQLETEPHHAPA